MNQFEIRFANKEHELARVADLISMARLTPITAQDLAEEETDKTPGTVWLWWVAVLDEAIVGAAQAVHFGSQAPGRYNLLLAVEPQSRRQGIGRALLDHVQADLRAQNGARLVCELVETHQPGLALAQKGGFKFFKHRVGSVLPLSTFDASRFASVQTALNHKGLRITSYASFENTLDNQRRLFGINRIAKLDDPGELERRFMPFTSWQKVVLQASWFDPAGQIIAVERSEFVGLSSIYLEPGRKTAEIGITGVAPEYRGRGVGMALKVEAIRYAQHCGAKKIRTENDSQNAPMLAINRKLGFTPERGQGFATLVKELV